jgi:hypothetical protein
MSVAVQSGRQYVRLSFQHKVKKNALDIQAAFNTLLCIPTVQNETSRP